MPLYGKIVNVWTEPNQQKYFHSLNELTPNDLMPDLSNYMTWLQEQERKEYVA